MGQHKLGSIMKTLTQTLGLDGKRISNHLTRKSVVAKLKKTGQPWHKIIQITGHANESSLDDYDKIEENERRTLSHTISSYSGTHTNTAIAETPPSSSSSSVLSSPVLAAVRVPSSSVSMLSSAAAIKQTSAQSFTHQSSHLPLQLPVNHTFNDPAVQHFNNCTVNIQNYFGPQSTNQASSSSVECQIGEIAKSPSIPLRKRR